jgi:hypothetical protein
MDAGADGIEIPENLFDPISAPGKQLVEEVGDAAPIRWLHRATATVKTATRHHHRPDRKSIRSKSPSNSSDEIDNHYGLLPRVNAASLPSTNCRIRRTHPGRAF